MVAEQDEYIRQRIEPQLQDLHYIHLSDLLLSLTAHRTDEAFRILDYGAGVCPYRGLFPNAVYERADISGVAGAEYVLREDGTVPAPSSSFDIVVSTQVIEHVLNPRIYIAECNRVLRLGGMLLLSTHGLFEDHGCPYDFQRWTADGLRRDLKAAGFEVQHMYKLTSDARALLYLFERWANTSQTTIGRSINRLLVPSALRFLHRMCDRKFPEHRVVAEPSPSHVIYIALLAVSRKIEAV
jgi:SAM-dependent methyltransferase